MTAIKVLIATIGLGCLGWQESATFTSGGSRVFLTNATHGSVDGLAQGDKQKHVLATGEPAQIHSPEKGLTARGRTLEFTWAELDPKTMEIRQGRIDGQGTIIIDGEESQKALAEDAVKLNQPVPKPQSESSYMQIDSELFSYSGTVKHATLTMPNAFTFKQTGKGISKQTKGGKEVDTPFDQSFDATGTSGTISLVPGPDETLNQVELGTIEGPVHFKLVRHEFPADSGKTSTSTYTGVADHIDINLLSHPGTITASGHVIVDADLNGDTCHFAEDKFVFLVSEKMEPLGLQFAGKPGETKAKAKDGGK